jgi:ABC-2 type transport system permease protein
MPRFAWERLFQQRLVLVILIASFIWPLLCGVFIYIANRSELWAGLSTEFAQFIQANGDFFLIFMRVQAVFCLVLAALAGPGLIAPDLANNSLPLYFSRPMTRADYVFAKLAVLVGLLSLITWVPRLLLFGMQCSMAGWSWFTANWKLGFGVFAGFAIWVLLVSLVALASSAYVKWRTVAGGSVLGFFFILAGVSQMVNGILRVTWGSALDPSYASHRIWKVLLNVTETEGPSPGACVATLLVFAVLLSLVLERKLRPVEVIS